MYCQFENRYTMTEEMIQPNRVQKTDQMLLRSIPFICGDLWRSLVFW